jgi:hypothetical protein
MAIVNYTIDTREETLDRVCKFPHERTNISDIEAMTHYHFQQRGYLVFSTSYYFRHFSKYKYVSNNSLNLNPDDLTELWNDSFYYGFNWEINNFFDTNLIINFITAGLLKNMKGDNDAEKLNFLHKIKPHQATSILGHYIIIKGENLSFTRLKYFRYSSSLLSTRNIDMLVQYNQLVKDDKYETIKKSYSKAKLDKLTKLNVLKKFQLEMNSFFDFEKLVIKVSLKKIKKCSPKFKQLSILLKSANETYKAKTLWEHPEKGINVDVEDACIGYLNKEGFSCQYFRRESLSFEMLYLCLGYHYFIFEHSSNINFEPNHTDWFEGYIKSIEHKALEILEMNYQKIMKFTRIPCCCSGELSKNLKLISLDFIKKLYLVFGVNNIIKLSRERRINIPFERNLYEKNPLVGFPDIVAIKDNELHLFEVKSPTDQLQISQKIMINDVFNLLDIPVTLLLVNNLS